MAHGRSGLHSVCETTIRYQVRTYLLTWGGRGIETGVSAPAYMASEVNEAYAEVNPCGATHTFI